jgi:hypothetical protein
LRGIKWKNKIQNTQHFKSRNVTCQYSNKVVCDCKDYASSGGGDYAFQFFYQLWKVSPNGLPNDIQIDVEICMS